MATQQYVLTGTDANNYTFVVHYLTPAGSNAVGTPWSTALVNAGLNTTILAIGTGAGQILQADHDAIVAGTMVEIVGRFSFGGFAGLTGAQQQAALNSLAASMIATSKTQLQTILNFYGFTQGVAS